jgi:hypothetical protein
LPHEEVVIEPENKVLSVLWRRPPCHRRGYVTAARQDPGQDPGDRNAPAQVCVPDLHGWCGASARAPAPHRGRVAD